MAVLGGAIYLVKSYIEQDSSLLSILSTPLIGANFLKGQVALNHMRLGDNRSVMALDVRGFMRTLKLSACFCPGPEGNPLNLLHAWHIYLCVYIIHIHTHTHTHTHIHTHTNIFTYANIMLRLKAYVAKIIVQYACSI